MVCALIVVLPIVLLNLLFGAFTFNPWSSENLLFFAHFGIAGFTFGILYVRFIRRPASVKEQNAWQIKRSHEDSVGEPDGGAKNWQSCFQIRNQTEMTVSDKSRNRSGIFVAARLLW